MAQDLPRGLEARPTGRLDLLGLARASMVSSSALAAMTKHHRRGGSSSTPLFLSVLEAGKSGGKVLA